MRTTAIQYGVTAAALSAAFVHYRARHAERENPPLGRFIDVDGVRMHYLERGAGTPLVMLHGLGSMIQELMLSGLYELAAARYRVILVDRPGHGYSERPRRKWWGPRSQASLVRAMLTRLGIERPIIFGHSFGALVALAYALEYPAALRSVVLASGYYFPSARFDVPLMAPPVIPLIGDALRHTVSPLIGRALWPRFMRRVFRPAPVPRRFLNDFPVWMSLRPSQLRAAAEDATLLLPSAMHLARLYGALEAPAVIVAGMHDDYVDHAHHSIELSRRLPRCELMLLPRAGHMVHHVEARRVLQAIEAAAAR